jgi:hypothetical protein
MGCSTYRPCTQGDGAFACPGAKGPAAAACGGGGGGGDVDVGGGNVQPQYFFVDARASTTAAPPNGTNFVYTLELAPPAGTTPTPGPGGAATLPQVGGGLAGFPGLVPPSGMRACPVRVLARARQAHYNKFARPTSATGGRTGGGSPFMCARTYRVCQSDAAGRSSLCTNPARIVRASI